MKFFPPLILVAAMSGCALAPEYRRPDMNLPNAWHNINSQQAGKFETAPSIWWKQFGNRELVRIIDEVLRRNNDLGAALQRVEQARAQVSVAGAELWPSVSASGQAFRTDGKRIDYGYLGQWQVAYEVDIWQRNRSVRNASEARLGVSELDRDALALTVTAEAARFYFEVLNLKQRQQIARENLAIARDVLEIVASRFQEGAASELELAQQKTALANAEAVLTALQRQQMLLENALSVLRGLPAGSGSLAGESLETLNVPDIAPRQPADLLERRPDLRRAEAELVAARYDIRAAKAAFFPQLRVGLDTLLTAVQPGVAATTLAAALLTPLVQGANLQGELDLTRAREQELLEAYRKAVLVSVRETEDALVSINAARQRQVALQTAVQEARTAYRIARERYQAGAVDFLNVLETQRARLQTEDSLAQVQLERTVASVDLYKALGGGWSAPSAVTHFPLSEKKPCCYTSPKS